MKYLSTRGGMAPQTFSEVLLEGLAPDGGLVVPEALPALSTATLESWRELSYAEVANEVLRLFIDDIPAEVLQRLTHITYTKEVFGSEAIVPLRPLNHFTLVKLSEGPTLAFKDIAMQLLGNLFEYVLAQRGGSLNILGATSGDTGSAAEYALRGKKGINVFMLSPDGRMSPFQRAQMYTLQDANIHNIALRGVFDDCQDVVKALAGDVAFKTAYHLGAVNSINWARVVAQIVYYVYGWLRATTRPDQQVSFAVPSGNFGNILAGHLARQMGLPVRWLVLATNENNVLEEFFRTGIYRPRSAKQTYATSSPSMDISRASNFERFVYDLVDKDASQVVKLWQELSQSGQFDLSERRACLREKYGFVAGVSTHADRLQTIRTVYEEGGILIDPHTADGVKVASAYVESGIPMLVLETALPAKFPTTIEAALGHAVAPHATLAKLALQPQRVKVMDCDPEAVKAYIRSHAILY